MESASKTKIENTPLGPICDPPDPGHVPNYWAQIGKELIDREYSRLRSVEEIASLLGISAGHFREMFRVAFGVTPKPYLTQVKINEARKLLESQFISIGDVAVKVGIPSSKVFRTHFKELLGGTPSEYRRTQSTREVNL